MYNLHCHSLLSDGVLLPSELAVRHLASGYKVIAITDHADYSNIDTIINGILEFTAHWPREEKIKVLPGIELTHLPLEQFEVLSRRARKKGIQVIVGHGETLAEPVIKGTNRAALAADIDILAHPGLISDAEVKLAKKRGVFLEITTRQAHSATNAHVAKQALKFGAKLILNTDGHSPQDILSPDRLINFGRKAGLKPKDIHKIFWDTQEFIQRNTRPERTSA